MEFDHVVNHHFDLPLVLPVAINGNAKVSPRQPCLRAALDPDSDLMELRNGARTEYD
jgi:hypothetical protein